MSALRDLLADVERGHYPADELTVVQSDSPAVLAFTGRNVVAADVDPEWVRRRVPAGDLSAPMSPPFLTELGDALGRRVHIVDALLLAPAADGDPQVVQRQVEHPRVTRAQRYRRDLRTFTVDGGVLALGRGIGDRWEAAIEVDPASQGRGIGRSLALAARSLVPAGAHVWAEVSPGNAASLRAFLAAGYRPVGAEALLVR